MLFDIKSYKPGTLSLITSYPAEDARMLAHTIVFYNLGCETQRVLLISDMPKKDITEQMKCSMASVRYQKYARAELTEEEAVKVEKAAEELKQRLTIAPMSERIEDISRAIQDNNSEPFDLVVVEMVDLTKFDPDGLVLLNELRGLAGKTNIPIIAALKTDSDFKVQSSKKLRNVSAFMNTVMCKYADTVISMCREEAYIENSWERGVIFTRIGTAGGEEYKEEELLLLPDYYRVANLIRILRK